MEGTIVFNFTCTNDLEIERTRVPILATRASPPPRGLFLACRWEILNRN